MCYNGVEIDRWRTINVKDKFTISSGDLSATVLMPESPEYARTRFDHSVFVPDVM